MSFAVGHSVPGYMPKDVAVVETFAEAKAVLIWDLKFQENYADSEGLAEDFCSAAEDVNLWNSPQDTDELDGEVWWIMNSDEDAEDAS